jgi:hypothetical protein
MVLGGLWNDRRGDGVDDDQDAADSIQDAAQPD